MTFGCKITEADYVGAFGPEQPDEVKVGQTWMRATDGTTLPVMRVADGQVDLGADTYLLVIGIRELREEWVCTDPPENVTTLPERMEVPERRPPTEPQTWYFTFGFSSPYKGRYVRIEGATSEEARDRMLAMHGREWGFQYDETDWFKHGVAQSERYGLTELV